MIKAVVALAEINSTYSSHKLQYNKNKAYMYMSSLFCIFFGKYFFFSYLLDISTNQGALT